MKKLIIYCMLVGCLNGYGSQTSEDFPSAKIAVIGGTFINDALIDSPYLKGSFTYETSAGVSPNIYYGEVEGVPFYYVHFHGRDQLLETWSALYHLGVKEAIGGATAGGINPLLKPYDYIIPDDLIDFNIDRDMYIVPEVMGPDARVTARMSPATDPLLSKILHEEALRVVRSHRDLDDVNVHLGGVHMQARGQPFQSVAEIKFYKQVGGDLVTKHTGTEMNYARQLGINYACLNLISNPAEGMGEWEWDNLKKIYPRMNPVSLEIIVAVIPRIGAIEEDTPRAIDRLLRWNPGFSIKADKE